MAFYKEFRYLTYSSGEEFDKIHTPGTLASYSGIYRCEGCGDEIAANKYNPLPSQNHSQHGQTQGAIRWRLIVRTQTN